MVNPVDIDPWSPVVGQSAAVDFLKVSASDPVHAYLFVGPPGSGKRAAVRAFSGELLGVGRDEQYQARSRRLAADEMHPDLVIIEPDAATFRFPKSSSGDSPGLRFVNEVHSSPREGELKVVVAVDFHLAAAEGVGKLLKTIEEPPPTTVIVLLQEEIPTDQITIASRCAVVNFGPVSTTDIAQELLGSGVDSPRANLIAEASRGDLGRARLLVDDNHLAARLEAWASVPYRLDGTGARVHQLFEELNALMGEAVEPLKRAQEAELEIFLAESEARGSRGRKKDLQEKHKRAIRRHEIEEIQHGLATVASTYRAALATGDTRVSVLNSLQAVVDAGYALSEHNPTRPLLVKSLFLNLEHLEQ